MSLKYKTYFRHVHRLKHYLYLRPFNVLSFKKSLILTIKYTFSLFLVFRLYKSGLQVRHLNSNHLIFLGSVDIGGTLQWYVLKNKVLLYVIFQMFLYFIWSVNCVSLDFISQDILDMEYFLFESFQYWINGNCKTKHYLFQQFPLL